MLSLIFSAVCFKLACSNNIIAQKFFLWRNIYQNIIKHFIANEIFFSKMKPVSSTKLTFENS